MLFRAFGELNERYPLHLECLVMDLFRELRDQGEREEKLHLPEEDLELKGARLRDAELTHLCQDKRNEPRAFRS